MNDSIAQVLIVDQDALIALDMQRLLQTIGLQATIVSSGEQGLATARQRRFDLLILGVHLHRMGGLEVCRRLKEDIDLKAIPVVFVSAESSPPVVEKAFELGAVDYVIKPYDTEEFKRRVLAHLTKRTSG